MAKETNWALSAIDPPTVPDSLTSGTSVLVLNQEQWPERYQDLSDYCNTGSKTMDNLAQQSGEQLNTPIISVEDADGFDFGLRSLPRDRFDVFDECDYPWEASSSSLNNSNNNNNNNSTNDTELWGDVSNWLSGSNIKDQDDLYNVDIDVAEEKPPQDLLTSDRDILLSQSSSNYNQKQSYYDPVSQSLNIIKTNVNQQQPFVLTDFDKSLCNNNNNNNSNNINMNNNNTSNVINSNNLCNNKINCFPDKSQSQERLQQCNLVYNPTPQKALLKSNECISGSFIKNRRDPVNNNNLSSIFKSEEPFIGESNKQFSTSCSSISNSCNDSIISRMSSNDDDSLKLTTIIITPEVVATTSSAAAVAAIKSLSSANKDISRYSNKSVNNTIKNIINDDNRYNNSNDSSSEYIIPDSIKPEPIDIADLEVETIYEHKNDPINQPSDVRRQFKIPSRNNNVKKSGLKLDIDSAAKLVTTSIQTGVTPTMATGDTGVSFNTPDVLRPLLSNDVFSLLTYIGDEEIDESTEPNLLSNSENSSPAPVDVSRKNIAIIKPVRQSKKSSRVIVEKCESAMYESPPKLQTVKEENIIEEHMEESHYSNHEEHDKFIDSPPTKIERVSRRAVSKRRRIVKKSEDMESDLSNISDDYIEEDDEEHDKTFLPTPNRRKRTVSSTSRSSTTSHISRRKLSITRETDSSDHESIASSADRYRELRDRNNEASRRSRLNRKSRELEMKQQAVQLEQENKRLKAKADEMERLVKRLREGLLQLVLKKR